MIDGTPTEQTRPKRVWPWIVLGLIVIVIVASLIWWFGFRPVAPAAAPTSVSTSQSPTWAEGGVAVPGEYADADTVSLDDGTTRMYYSVEPEVQGNKLELFSAVSADGVTWTTESGTRKTFATFPDVIKLPNGSWRMYFQNSGVIKSALSTDGLTFTDEAGVRLDAQEPGFTLENVGAQSTTILPDGSFLMVYRGTINEPYQSTEKLPNQNTQLYFWATSPDGLTFTRRGMAIDSRDETLLGLTDGADFVRWDNGELRVYFWSYTGVYYATYADGAFTAPVFAFTNNQDPMMKFAPNPPGDPTLIKIKDRWFMYYGQHTKGIYYATQR